MNSHAPMRPTAHLAVPTRGDRIPRGLRRLDCRAQRSVIRTRRRAVAALAAALAVLLLACADAPGPGDPGDPIDDATPLTIDQVDAATIDALCRVLVRCHVVSDLATCRAQDLDLGINADLLAAVKAGKILFHGDRARECLRSSLPAQCNRAEFLLERAPSLACLETYEGTVAAGAACTFNGECVSQRCDLTMCGTESCCVGRCVGGAAPGHAQVGESCEVARCAEGFCDPVTRRCAAYLEEGQRCSGTWQCQSGLACHLTCQREPTLGQACTISTGCRDLGTMCSETSSTCVAVGLAGARCRSDRECSPLYRCDADGTCALAPQRGDACTSTCGDRSYCDRATMTCAAPQGNGATCQGGSDCESGYCDFDLAMCTERPICI